MAWVQPLVKGLISHKLSSMVQKTNKQTNKKNTQNQNPPKTEQSARLSSQGV